MLRQALSDPAFIDAHRQRPQDFTRHRALPFATVVSWLLLNFQSSMRQSLQRLLDDLSGGTLCAVTKGAISQARAKLKASALIALNERLVRHADQGARLTTKIFQRLSSEAEAVRPNRIYPRDAKPLRRGYPVAYKQVAQLNGIEPIRDMIDEKEYYITWNQRWLN